MMNSRSSERPATGETVAEVDGLDSELGGGDAVGLGVVDEQALGGGDAGEPLQGQLVDPRVGLAHPDEGRVDDRLEDLVDRQLRAPDRLPFADVVGQDRHPVAATRQLRHQRDHLPVRVEPVEVGLPEAVEAGPLADQRLEAVAEDGEEAVLADPAALELEQRVAAVELRGARRHRGAELLERDAGVLLKAREGAEQRRGEHAAEVTDDGADRHGRGFLPKRGGRAQGVRMS